MTQKQRRVMRTKQRRALKRRRRKKAAAKRQSQPHDSVFKKIFKRLPLPFDAFSLHTAVP